MKEPLSKVLAALASLKLTLVCIGVSMVLILLSTFAQTEAGIYYVKKTYFDTFFVWKDVGGMALPVFPGGFLAGAVLLVNLLAAHITRISLKPSKIGIFLTHAGLILLIAGMFFSSILTVESRLEIDEGQSKNWTEDYQLVELVVIDTSNPDYDEVISFPQSMFKRGVLHHERLPFDLRIERYYPNAGFINLTDAPDAPPMSEKGFGATLTAMDRPLEIAQDRLNFRTLIVEPMIGAEGLGTIAVSNAFPRPERLALSGTSYMIQVRPMRYYLPYTLTLVNFQHDRYPGTQIPKNFSSEVIVSTAEQPTGVDHDIYMNHPLRHDGKTFYQAQFKNDEKTSILQVVDNPGWTVPYISCTLISIGLLWHFMIGLSRFLNRRSLAA